MSIAMTARPDGSQCGLVQRHGMVAESAIKFLFCAKGGGLLSRMRQGAPFGESVYRVTRRRVAMGRGRGTLGEGAPNPSWQPLPDRLTVPGTEFANRQQLIVPGRRICIAAHVPRPTGQFIFETLPEQRPQNIWGLSKMRHDYASLCSASWRNLWHPPRMDRRLDSLWHGYNALPTTPP
jgi:hypothetical protein